MWNFVDWKDLNIDHLGLSSHYIVPELGPEIKFKYSSHKSVDEYKEDKEVSIILCFTTITFIFEAGFLMGCS